MEATVEFTRMPDDTPVTVTMTAGEARAYLLAVGPISTDNMIRLPYEGVGKTISEQALSKASGVLYDLYCALDDAVADVTS